MSGIRRTTNEFGQLASGSRYAWTAVKPSGQPSGSECERWLTAIPTPSTAGSLQHTGANWTLDPAQAACSEQLHLYCFEQ